MRLIDADALVKELSDKYIVPVDEATRGVAAFIGIQVRQAINNAPTIEVEPIKHGQNLANERPRRARIFFCSECGYGFNDIFLCNERDYPIEPNYCPNCGARMDEKEK